jgi:hypothetical protein
MQLAEHVVALLPLVGHDADPVQSGVESSSGAAADRSASGRRDAARQHHSGPSAPQVSRADWRFPPGGPVEAGLSAASNALPGSSAVISSSIAAPTGSPAPDVSGSAISSGYSGSPTVSSPVAAPAVPLDMPHTRLQSGVSKPKKFTDGTIRYAYFCSTGEPSSTAEAFKDSRWKAAMDDEYDALIKNGTWHLVPATHGQNVIDCKWVYKVKRKADGTTDRYKARLVAKGFK